MVEERGGRRGGQGETGLKTVVVYHGNLIENWKLFLLTINWEGDYNWNNWIIKCNVRNNLCAVSVASDQTILLSKDMSLISPTPCHPTVWNPSELKSCKDAGPLGPAVYRNLWQKAYLVLLSKFFCISAQRRSISLDSWKWGQASVNKTGMRTPLPLQLATSERPSHSWGTPNCPHLSHIVTEGMRQFLPLCCLVWNQFMMLVHGNHSFHWFWGRFFSLWLDVSFIRSWPLDLGICNSI